jgi:hypothetical protein
MDGYGISRIGLKSAANGLWPFLEWTIVTQARHTACFIDGLRIVAPSASARLTAIPKARMFIFRDSNSLGTGSQNLPHLRERVPRQLMALD